MSIVKKLIEGDTEAAKTDLTAKLNQKRDEVLSIAKAEIQSKVLKGEGAKE